jgi:hypothetical protein
MCGRIHLWIKLCNFFLEPFPSPMNGGGEVQQQLAVLLPGYRLWLVFVEITWRDLSIVTRLVSQLELCPGVNPGRLLVLTRSATLDFRELPSARGLPRQRWLAGARAAEVINDQIAAGHVRGPVIERGGN